MATESIILVPSSNLDLFDRKHVDTESAVKVSEVLQENHDSHHVFFNGVGHHVRLLAILIKVKPDWQK